MAVIHQNASYPWQTLQSFLRNGFSLSAVYLLIISNTRRKQGTLCNGWTTVLWMEARVSIWCNVMCREWTSSRVMDEAYTIKTRDRWVACLTSALECSWCLKKLTTQLFFEYLAEANNDKNIQISHYWPIVKGIQWWPVDSPHKGTVKWNAFP